MSAYGVVDLGFTNSSHRYGQFQQDIPNQCCAICSSTAILGMVFIDFMPTCQVYRDVLQNEFTSLVTGYDVDVDRSWFQQDASRPHTARSMLTLNLRTRVGKYTSGHLHVQNIKLMVKFIQ
jgi:hypothetical protein